MDLEAGTLEQHIDGHLMYTFPFGRDDGWGGEIAAIGLSLMTDPEDPFGGGAAAMSALTVDCSSATIPLSVVISSSARACSRDGKSVCECGERACWAAGWRV